MMYSGVASSCSGDQGALNFSQLWSNVIANPWDFNRWTREALMTPILSPSGAGIVLSAAPTDPNATVIDRV